MAERIPQNWRDAGYARPRTLYEQAEHEQETVGARLKAEAKVASPDQLRQDSVEFNAAMRKALKFETVETRVSRRADDIRREIRGSGLVGDDVRLNGLVREQEVEAPASLAQRITAKRQQLAILLRKNAARVRGDTEAKRAAGQDLRDSRGTTGDIEVAPYTRADGTRVQGFRRRRAPA